MARDDLTAEYVRSVLHYNPETGQLWRKRVRSSVRADRCGPNGYTWVYLNEGKTSYYTHRVVWLWVHGAWPAGEVDHVNGVKTDNRLVNLRAVTKALNQQNIRQPRAGNQSGYLGVSYNSHGNRRKRWVATIMVDGKNRNLGSYLTPEAAYAVYLSAKRRFHPGCTL